MPPPRILLGRPLLLVCGFIAVCLLLANLARSEQPVELGRVAWLRDYDAARKLSAKSGKPMLVLFDEVPGCATCQQFGNGPLSHPLVVDAAQEFIPVAVYNNVSGKDAVWLKRFEEPAWNNPIVRFVSAEERDLIPRKSGVYSVGEVFSRMVMSLERAERPVPEYLKIAKAEYAPAKRETATFAMFCYWEGEKRLGDIDGVIGTRIGMLKGREVVELDFDPTVVPYESLVKQAMQMDCAHTVFARSDEQAQVARKLAGNRVAQTDEAVDTGTQQQYHLAHYKQYYLLPLSPLQATRANASIANRQRPDHLLSPSQLKLRDRLQQLLDDPNGAQRLAKLKPDRSSAGLVDYARELSSALQPEQGK